MFFVFGDDVEYLTVSVWLPPGRAESAHEIDNNADQQNQAQPAAADGRTTKVKPAATEQQKQHNNNE